jgi:RNA polymerase sigma factor (sigma-70 family)
MNAMMTQTMTGLLRHAYRAAFSGEGAGLSDGQLLDYFLARRDPEAFACLVRRHGPMVLGVCRRVLRHAQDAEDAFQATFLVLVRRAEAVLPRERVGPWLHGVAYRTALKARAVSARRRGREAPLESVDPEAPSRDEFSDLKPLLDRELARLPDAYRAPVILCDLQGRSRAEAARELGVPEGTVSSRLARGRHLLGERLARQGVALGAMTALLAVPSTTLTASTIQAATAIAAGHPAAVSVTVAALMQGVIRTMFLSKLKPLAVLGLVAALVVLPAGSAFSGRALADRPELADRVTASASTAVAFLADKADKPAQGPTINGTVKETNSSKKTVTLTVMKDPSKKLTSDDTYPLADNAKILFPHGVKKESKEGRLADIIEGDPVSAQLTPDKKAIVILTVHSRSYHGQVKSVDAGKNILIITFKSSGGQEEKAFELLPEAKITLDDGIGKKGDKAKEAKLADLTEGTSVVVQQSIQDRAKAVHVVASGRTLHGVVKSVDTTNNTITLNVKEDGMVVEKTVTLHKDARIDGAKLGDLSEGTFVSVRLSASDGKTGVGVHVHKKD